MPTDIPALRRFLRRQQVQDATGLGKSTLWKKIAEGTFPKPIKVSAGVYVWPEDVIAAWQAERVAEAEAREIGAEARASR